MREANHTIQELQSSVEQGERDSKAEGQGCPGSSSTFDKEQNGTEGLDDPSTKWKWWTSGGADLQKEWSAM